MVCEAKPFFNCFLYLSTGGDVSTAFHPAEASTQKGVQPAVLSEAQGSIYQQLPEEARRNLSL
jgi:hypothetical protein